MPPKLPTPIAIVAVVLVAVAAMFAWDASREDAIANDVRVGPVDVSGMTRAQARAAITERLLEPLDEPLVIQAAGKPFPLSAREAHISADVEAMVSAAVRRSREGGVLARTWRAISGRGIGARVAPAISYSRPAVQRIADRVRVAVSRPARDAKVSFAPATSRSAPRARDARSTPSSCAPTCSGRSSRRPASASSPPRSSASSRRSPATSSPPGTPSS